MNSPTDFALQYRTLADEQLLQIAGEGGLVDEAKLALHTEMGKRKLTTEMVEKYRAEQQRYEDQRKKSNPIRPTMDIGTRLYGRDFLTDEDRSRGIQVRTKWFCLRGLPIVPLASYRYSCQNVTTGLIDWKEEKLIGQVPLYWKQVIRTWIKFLLFFVAGITLVILFLAWQERSPR
jgi:hypothetical protein